MNICHETETLLFIQNFSNEETEPQGGEAPCPGIKPGLKYPWSTPFTLLIAALFLLPPEPGDLWLGEMVGPQRAKAGYIARLDPEYLGL